MRLVIATTCLAAMCAVTAGAQTSEKVTRSKITVEDGKSVTLTGCVATSGTGFILTNAADKESALASSYVLISDDENLSKHVGHRVQVKGKVTDQGDGKVKVETKSKTKVEHGDDIETSRRTEIQGDPRMAYLGVKSIKTIAAVCP